MINPDYKFLIDHNARPAEFDTDGGLDSVIFHNDQQARARQAQQRDANRRLAYLATAKLVLSLKDNSQKTK